jgi:D-amino-acid oxidase
VDNCTIFDTFVIDPEVMMGNLRQMAERKRVKFEHQHVDKAKLQVLLDQNVFVINCTGMGSAQLFDDNDLQGVTGYLLSINNRHLNMNDPTFQQRVYIYEKDTQCIESPHYDTKLAYIVIHRDRCILGGTFCKGKVDDEKLCAQNILQRCKNLREKNQSNEKLQELCSALNNVEHYEVLTAERPVRQKGLRVEIDSNNKKVIHNYGHGGSGWSLCWGSALEVLHLIDTTNMSSIQELLLAHISPFRPTVTENV